MVDNKKAARFSPAASKNKHFQSNYNVRAVLRTLLVRLAIWNLIPASLAQRLIHHGRLRHD
jgi:hypothetical protein